MGARVAPCRPALVAELLGSDFDELLQLLQVALPDASHHKLATDERTDGSTEPPREDQFFCPSESRTSAVVDWIKCEFACAGHNAYVAYAHDALGNPFGDFHAVDKFDWTNFGVAEK